MLLYFFMFLHFLRCFIICSSLMFSVFQCIVAAVQLLLTLLCVTMEYYYFRYKMAICPLKINYSR